MTQIDINLTILSVLCFFSFFLSFQIHLQTLNFCPSMCYTNEMSFCDKKCYSLFWNLWYSFPPLIGGVACRRLVGVVSPLIGWAPKGWSGFTPWQGRRATKWRRGCHNSLYTTPQSRYARQLPYQGAKT